MKHKLVCLTVHNLLLNHPNLIRFNTETAAHQCSMGVLNNQKQLLADVLQNRCSEKFHNIQRKTPVLESLFNKVAGLQIHILSSEYCKNFKNSFSIKHLRWLLLKNS